MQAKISFQLAVVGLGLVLTLGGLWAMRAELSPYVTDRSSPTAQVLKLAGGGTRTGLSIQSQQLFLFDCRAALTSFAGYTQPSSVQNAFTDHCLETSDRLTEQSPSFSIAWFTGALAAARRQDWTGMNLRLLRSQTTGQAEMWIAEMRVELAEDHFEHLSGEVLEYHGRDLRLLAASIDGIAMIAERFVREADFRERVIVAVESLPEDDQMRFSNAIRRFVSNSQVIP